MPNALMKKLSGENQKLITSDKKSSYQIDASLAQHLDRQSKLVGVPENNFLPWEGDPVTLSPIKSDDSNKSHGNKKSFQMNSSFWFLVPAAAVACVLICHRLKSLGRMNTYLTSSLKSAYTLFANSKPAQVTATTATELKNYSISMC